MNETTVWYCPIIGCGAENVMTAGQHGGKCRQCNVYTSVDVSAINWDAHLLGKNMNNCIVEVNGRWLLYITPAFAPVVTGEQFRATRLPRKQADMIERHLRDGGMWAIVCELSMGQPIATQIPTGPCS